MPDFECYLRKVIELDEDDIQLILKQYISNFITYRSSVGFYSSPEVSEAVYTKGDHEGILQLKYDEMGSKTKPILGRFGATFGALTFDENSVYNTILASTPYWDSQCTNAIQVDSTNVYTGEKTLTLSTIDELRLESQVNDGSVFNGSRKPILISFLLDKPSR